MTEFFLDAEPTPVIGAFPRRVPEQRAAIADALLDGVIAYGAMLSGVSTDPRTLRPAQLRLTLIWRVCAERPGLDYEGDGFLPERVGLFCGALEDCLMLAASPYPANRGLAMGLAEFVTRLAGLAQLEVLGARWRSQAPRYAPSRAVSAARRELAARPRAYDVPARVRAADAIMRSAANLYERLDPDGRELTAAEADDAAARTLELAGAGRLLDQLLPVLTGQERAGALSMLSLMRRMRRGLDLATDPERAHRRQAASFAELAGHGACADEPSHGDAMARLRGHAAGA